MTLDFIEWEINSENISIRATENNIFVNLI